MHRLLFNLITILAVSWLLLLGAIVLLAITSADISLEKFYGHPVSLNARGGGLEISSYAKQHALVIA